MARRFNLVLVQILITFAVKKSTKMNKAFNSIPATVDDSKLEKAEVGCQVFSDTADEYPSGLRHISEVLTYYIKVIDLKSYGNSCISKSL